MKHLANRTGAALLSLCLLLALAACGQTGPAGTTSAVMSAPQGNSAPVAFSGGEIHMLTDGEGIRDNGGPAGFYALADVVEGGDNIVYTDYATATRIFLCGRPECLHIDDSCASWIPSHSQGGTVMSDATGSRLLYFGGGMAAENPEIYGIYVMDPDGANRKELCRLESGQILQGAVASDGQNLYFPRITMGSADISAVSEICQLDFDTGTLRVVADFGDSGGWLAGAFDDKLVIGVYSNTTVICRTLSPATGETADVYRYDYTADELSAAVLGDKLVLMRKTGETTGDMVSVSLRDGSETTLYTDLPMLHADTTYATGFGSLMVWQMYDSSAGTKVCYALDVESGGLAQITLMTLRFGEERPLWVFADAGDSLLVVTSDAETGTRTVNDNAGNPYTIPVTTMTYALISKADYLANQPNYTPITDEVLAG